MNIFLKISEDYGKDLTSVQNLQKKHALMEADFSAHQDRIDGVKIAADQFYDSGHFDAENIKQKQVIVLQNSSNIWILSHFIFHCVVKSRLILRFLYF